MLKIVAVFIVLLIFVIPGVWAEVYIENDYKYISNDDTIHIVGEIINDSSTPLNQVTISAIIYSGENIIHEANTDTLTNLIMPGMKAVFDLQITENIDTIDNYLLDIDYKVTYPKKQVIEITSSEMKYGPSQNLIIQGTVANHGDATANMINVIATLYDKDGILLAYQKLVRNQIILERMMNQFLLLLFWMDQNHMKLSIIHLLQNQKNILQCQNFLLLLVHF